MVFPSLLLAWATLVDGQTSRFEQEIFYCHNIVRCMSGQEPVVWDNGLAQKAYDAVLRNGHFYEGVIHERDGLYGENLHHVPSGLNTCLSYWKEQRLIKPYGKDWHTEEKLQEMEDKGLVIGHFTTMAWKSVKRMGCAQPDNQPPNKYSNGKPSKYSACWYDTDGEYGSYKTDVYIGCYRTQSFCERNSTVNPLGQEAFSLSRQPSDLQDLQDEVYCGSTDLPLVRIANNLNAGPPSATTNTTIPSTWVDDNVTGRMCTSSGNECKGFPGFTCQNPEGRICGNDDRDCVCQVEPPSAQCYQDGKNMTCTTKKFMKKTATAEECLNLCKNKEKCTAWVWHKANTEYWGEKCYLCLSENAEAAYFPPDEVCISGKHPCASAESIESSGADKIKQLDDAMAKALLAPTQGGKTDVQQAESIESSGADKIKQLVDAKAKDFLAPTQGGKTDVQQVGPPSSQCKQDGKNMFCTKRKFMDKTATAEDCLNLCKDEEICTAWVWHKANTGDWAKECYLCLSEDAEDAYFSPNKICISGKHPCASETSLTEMKH